MSGRGEGETNYVDRQVVEGVVPDIVVTPEPSEEELAAIVAAVTLLSQRHQPTDLSEAAPSPVTSRWANAGRREAMRGLSRDDEKR